MEGALSGAQRFAFKPALLARRRWFSVDADQVSSGKDGQDADWRLDLNTVQAAVFVTHSLRGTQMWRLDLSDGRMRRSISLTLGVGAAADDPDRMAFLALVGALGAALARTAPGLRVALGETGGLRWVWFLIGAFSFVASLGLIGLAVATGVSTEKLVVAGGGFGLIGLLGVVIMRSFWPWRAPPDMAVGDLAALTDGLRGGANAV